MSITLSKKKVIIIASITGAVIVGLSTGLGICAYKATHPDLSLTEIMVTFETNGGTSISPIKLHIGEKLDKNKISTTRGSGYSFLGWFTDKELTKEFSFDNPLNTSLILYAKWDLNETTTGLEYEENASGDGYLVSKILGSIADNIKIPSMHEGKPVTGIKERVFMDSSIRSIVLPESIVEIDDGAFKNCQILNSIKMGDNITYLGNNCFEDCPSLTNVIFSKNLVYIGEAAFKNCVSLESAVLPDGIESLNKETFYNCKRLYNVSLGKRISDLKENVFENCTSLKEITFPVSLTDISGGAFLNSGLTKINHEDGDSAWRVLYDNTDIPLDALPSNLVNDGNAVFKKALDYKDSNNLVFYKKGKNKQGIDVVGVGFTDESIKVGSSITIPETVEINGTTYTVDEITKGAFDSAEHESSTNLTEIVIPKTIEKISKNAFKGCVALNKVTFSSDSKLSSIGSDAFKGCTALTDIKLPDSLLSIGNNAFSQSKLTSIKIPKNVSVINYGYFEGNNIFPFADIVTLTSLEVDSDNNYYSSYKNGFYLKKNDLSYELEFIPLGCNGTFEMSDECQTMNHYTLRNSNIETFKISSAFKKDFKIYECFLNTNKLKAITVSDSNVSYLSKDGVLFNKITSLLNDPTSDELIVYPQFKTITDNTYSIPDSITTIGNYAFYKNKDLTTILINSNNIKLIGAHAFDGCKNLKTIFNNENKFYNSSTSISVKEYAFNDTNLATIYIASNCSVEDFSFYINSLSSVKVDDSNVANLPEEYTPGEGGKSFLFEHAQKVYVKNDITLNDDSYIKQYFNKGSEASGYIEYTRKSV